MWKRGNSINSASWAESRICSHPPYTEGYAQIATESVNPRLATSAVFRFTDKTIMEINHPWDCKGLLKKKIDLLWSLQDQGIYSKFLFKFWYQKLGLCWSMEENHYSPPSHLIAVSGGKTCFGGRSSVYIHTTFTYPSPPPFFFF